MERGFEIERLPYLCRKETGICCRSRRRPQRPANRPDAWLCHRCAGGQPLWCRADWQGRLWQCPFYHLLRAAGWLRIWRTAPDCRNRADVCGWVPARAVWPARRFVRPVYLPFDRQGTAGCAHRPYLHPFGQHPGPGARAGQALSGQPGGKPSGFAGKAGHPWNQLRDSHCGRDAGRVHQLRHGRPGCVRDPLRPCDGHRWHRVLPILLPGRGAPRPDYHRNSDDRHLLVGPLPPHYLPDQYRKGADRHPLYPQELWKVSGAAGPAVCQTGQGQADEPDGPCGDRREGAQGGRSAERPRRKRRNQCLYGQNHGGCGREGWRLAAALQKRDP